MFLLLLHLIDQRQKCNWNRSEWERTLESKNCSFISLFHFIVWGTKATNIHTEKMQCFALPDSLDWLIDDRQKNVKISDRLRYIPTWLRLRVMSLAIIFMYIQRCTPPIKAKILSALFPFGKFSLLIFFEARSEFLAKQMADEKCTVGRSFRRTEKSLFKILGRELATTTRSHDFRLWCLKAFFSAFEKRFNSIARLN